MPRFCHVPCGRRVGISLLVVALLLLLAGCANPTARLDAVGRGFDRSTVTANGFRLTVFSNERYQGSGTPLSRDPDVSRDRDATLPPADIPLHVYLEGDGSPWKWKVIITPDPTPRQPLMLSLMGRDEASAVYVGRPCYNGTALDSGCGTKLWTSERYSESVVASMALAIRRLAAQSGATQLRLFGHSGGGTLAMLLAARLPATVDVVTLAGNLDPDAWTRHHGYLALRGSLNPANEPPLDPSIRQWHLVGEADTVVPPAITRPLIESQENAIGLSFPSFTHGCCWSRIWPSLLRAVVSREPGRLPGIPFRQAALPADARGDR